MKVAGYFGISRRLVRCQVWSLLGALFLASSGQQVWAAKAINIAPFGTASGTAAYASAPFDAIDGDRNGDFWGGGSVWYAFADPENPPLHFEVDLGTETYIDRIQVFRRTDSDNEFGQGESVFGNMRLTIFEDDGNGNPGNVSFTKDYLTGEFDTGGFQYGTWGTTDPGLSNPQGAFGRHVRLERIDNNYWLGIAEFEIYGNVSPLSYTEDNNIARGKPVTFSSGPGYGAQPTSGNDGNIDGNFGNAGYRPVYHSANFGVGEYWQVDLGAMTELNHLQLFSRTDSQTTAEYKVSVLNESLTEVISFIVDNPIANVVDPVYDHILNTAGAMGRYIRVETTQSNYLAFAELRAFEGPGTPFYEADFNDDGKVDSFDLLVWQNAYGTGPAGDADGDGDSDGRDFLFWQRQYGSGVTPISAVSAVPEPGTASLILLAASCCGFVSRRAR